MANPTASPTQSIEVQPTTVQPSVESYTHITIRAGAEFTLDCRADNYTRVWFGRPTAAALILHDAAALDRLINELCEALAYMRHEQANAKRCDARGRVVA